MVAVVEGQDGDGAGAGIAEVAAGHGGPVHQVIGDGDVLVGRVGQADREGDGRVAALVAGLGSPSETATVGVSSSAMLASPVLSVMPSAGVAAARVIGRAVEHDREGLRRLKDGSRRAR